MIEDVKKSFKDLVMKVVRDDDVFNEEVDFHVGDKVENKGKVEEKNERIVLDILKDLDYFILEEREINEKNIEIDVSEINMV